MRSLRWAISKSKSDDPSSGIRAAQGDGQSRPNIPTTSQRLMNIKERMLAVSLLEMASVAFASHGCNDWEFPNSWTKDEKIAFLKEYHEWNGDPEEFSERYLHIQDFSVMAFLAHKIEKMV